MKKVFVLILAMIIFFACSDEYDSREVYNPNAITPKTKELYYWDNSGNKVDLELENSMWHVLISNECYNRIQNAREMKGEKSLAYVACLDSAYFKRYASVVDDRIFDYVGYVETFVKRSELLPTDECLYKGFVYSSQRIPSYRWPNYNATSMRISVVVSNNYSYEQVQEILQPYSVVLYSYCDYYENTTLYELFYINGNSGDSAQAIVNALYESGVFEQVFRYDVIEWINKI